MFVVDDEEVMRGSLVEMLALFGYSCIVARDGREALDYLAAERREHRDVAAIIIDLTVPGGMGGREAIGAIREIDPAIPVFAMSGYAEDPAIALPKRFGFTDSLRKPFKMADLAERLNKYLS